MLKNAHITPFIELNGKSVQTNSGELNVTVNAPLKHFSQVFVKTISGSITQATTSNYTIELVFEVNILGTVSGNQITGGTDVTFQVALFIENDAPTGLGLSLKAGNIPLSSGLSKLGELISSGDFEVPAYFPTVKANLDHLSAYIDFTEGLQNLEGSLSLLFGIDEGWSPIPDSVNLGIGLDDLIKLEELDVSFSWVAARGVEWQVGGDGELAAYDLKARYTHPAQLLYAQLSPVDDTAEEIQRFLNERLGLDSGVSAIVSGALTAVELTIDAHLQQKSVLFRITKYGETPWQLLPHFSVTGLDFRVYWSNASFAKAEAYLNFGLPIGPNQQEVILGLEGTYDQTDTTPSWSFEAFADDPIAVGDLITGIATKFGASADAVPDAISDMTVDDLRLFFEYEEDTSNFEFSANLVFPVSGKELVIHLGVNLTKGAESTSGWEVQLETTVNISGYTFGVSFDNTDGQLILASFTAEDAEINLSTLLEEIAPDEIDAILPDDLELKINNAFVAFYLPPTPTNNSTSETDSTPAKKPKSIVAFGVEVDIDTTLDLSQVPAVGSMLGSISMEMEALRFVGSSGDLSETTLSTIEARLSELGIRGMREGQRSSAASVVPSSDSMPPPAMLKGVYLSLSLDLPEPAGKVPLSYAFNRGNTDLDTSTGGTASGSGGSPSGSSNTGSGSTTAKRKNRALQPVGQQIGPLFIENIGLSMTDGKFGLKFSGGLEVGPLAMQVINFTVASPLNTFAPSFDIDGLAAGYDKPPLTVAGLLMKFDETVPEVLSDQALLEQRTIGVRGGISIGFKQVTITALGAYAFVKVYDPPGAFKNSFHSLFIFGYLGAPLGGPPFLYVSGLALGAGFNRGLNLPLPSELTRFPLTAAALTPPGEALTVQDMKDMMLRMDDYIPVKQGNFWFAAGVKFESFKFLSGFLMITVEFGDELELGVIGILDAILPVASPEPVIRLSVGFVIRILPERGIIEARGAFLPTTFIFHEDVKITGSMAFLAVAKDQHDGEWAGAKAGEFIFTIGGYGPLYQPKDYYPTVRPLELRWQVNSNLLITARAYFALTPEAIMLGGDMHGLFYYEGGPVYVDVDFRAGVDFILYWSPMRYIGQAYAELHLKGGIEVDLGLFSVDKSLEMDASARIDFWGPEFSGKAKVKLHFIVSFSVSVDFGDASKEIQAINWNDFRESLLPRGLEVININLFKGIVQEPEERLVPTVNPYEVSFVIDSPIPLQEAVIEVENRKLGIKPMGVTSAAFISELTYTIQPLGAGREASAIEDFEITPVTKNVPSAIWQPAITPGNIPENTGVELIEQVVCGYEFKAQKPSINGLEELDTATLDDVLHGPVVKSGDGSLFTVPIELQAAADLQQLTHLFE